MNRTAMLGVLVLAAALSTRGGVAAQDAAPAAFADDRGSKVLARILPPPEPPMLAPGFRTLPLRRARRAPVESPSVSRAVLLTTLPSLAPARGAPLRPRALPERWPLADLVFEPVPPERIELPKTPRVRTPSRDVNLPLELPAQTTYQPKRASLDDPAAEPATQSVQGPTPAPRAKPAPFERVDLPDPFPNRAATREWPAEPPVVAPVPQPPK